VPPRVSSYMTGDVEVVTPTDTLAHARKVMLKRGIGRLVVVDEEDPSRPIGMLTITDIIDALLGRFISRPIDTILVGEVYTPELITIERTRTIKTAALTMLKHKIGGLPVVDEHGALVGIITRTDIVRAYSERYGGLYTVSQIMRRDYPKASPSHSVYHIAKMVFADPSGKVVIVDGERVVGVVTKRDLAFTSVPPRYGRNGFYKVKAVDRYRDKIVSLRVYTIPIAEDIMTPNPITVNPDVDSAEAASIMIREDIGILPVVVDDRLVGVLTKLEILEAVAGT
jgi:CBS domain-containing protein